MVVRSLKSVGLLRRRWSFVYTPLRSNSTIFKYNTKELEKEHSKPLIEYLKERGLVEAIANLEELNTLTSKPNGVKLYCGADPTAKSLHLGNLLPLLIMLHFNIRGHDIVGLVGGATGKVGDPSGRTTERDKINSKIQLDNTERIKSQLATFLNNSKEFLRFNGIPTDEKSKIEIVNNYDWWKDVTLLDFLFNYGKFIRINSMLARDSIKDRLNSDAGIGFHEFTYQILQAYDFWHLFKNHNVTVEVGGNDQWGNITAGIDFVNRMKGELKSDKQDNGNKLMLNRKVFGITAPLLTTSSGQKFGKSAGNAVFIDKEMTPSFNVYNFFMKTADADLEKLLKIFTFIPLQQIKEILDDHSKHPSLRKAQRILANEVTSLIHGKKECYNSSVIASILFPLPEEEYPTNLSTDTVLRIFEESNLLKKVSRERVIGTRFSTVLAEITGVSKSEARNTVKNGGLYIGYDRLKVDSSDSVEFSDKFLIDNKLILLRVGKAKYVIAELI